MFHVKQRSPADADAALEPYRELLGRYRRTLDLMSAGGHERVAEHLRDGAAYAAVVVALSPVPVRLVDVGSGAGLPAVAIAARLPELDLELIERRRKRVAFLSMAVAAIGAERASVRSGDVRRLDGPPADVVTAQAVGSLADVYALTRHRHAPTVTLLSRKGPDWRAEVQALESHVDAAVEVVAEEPLTHRGTLVAVRTLGGRRCRSSA